MRACLGHPRIRACKAARPRHAGVRAGAHLMCRRARIRFCAFILSIHRATASRLVLTVMLYKYLPSPGLTTSSRVLIAIITTLAAAIVCERQASAHDAWPSSAWWRWWWWWWRGLGGRSRGGQLSIVPPTHKTGQGNARALWFRSCCTGRCRSGSRRAHRGSDTRGAATVR